MTRRAVESQALGRPLGGEGNHVERLRQHLPLVASVRVGVPGRPPSRCPRPQVVTGIRAGGTCVHRHLQSDGLPARCMGHVEETGVRAAGKSPVGYRTGRRHAPVKHSCKVVAKRFGKESVRLSWGVPTQK
jgi:hypothetical protein